VALATADFITACVGDGLSPETAYGPEFQSSELQFSYTDLTGHEGTERPTSPNAFVCKVTAEESVLDALDALPNTSELVGTRELIEDEGV
jgi:hypothetical protein